jgi:hypothetical protein
MIPASSQTASGLVDGGSPPKPGEASLAHARVAKPPLKLAEASAFRPVRQWVCVRQREAGSHSDSRSATGGWAVIGLTDPSDPGGRPRRRFACSPQFLDHLFVVPSITAKV